jgi:hypothetical protein
VRFNVMSYLLHWWRRSYRAVRAVFHGKCRASDVEYLWEALCRESRSLDQARQAFLLHVRRDPAWTDHYSEKELQAYVNYLRPPETYTELSQW